MREHWGAWAGRERATGTKGTTELRECGENTRPDTTPTREQHMAPHRSRVRSAHRHFQSCIAW